MKRTVYLFIFLFCLNINLNYLYSINQSELVKFLSSINKSTVEIIQHKYVSSIDKTFSTYSLAKFEKGIGFIFKHNNDIFISTTEKYCYNKEAPKSLKDLPKFSDTKSLVDSLITKEQPDLKILEDVFDISYGKYLILKPTNSHISKWLKKISIKMDSQKIDIIEIIYQNGDKITLQLKPTKKVIQDEISC